MTRKNFRIKKYRDKFFKLKEIPPIGMLVVYYPSYDTMIYLIHDGAYANYRFKPGDIMTIKKVEKHLRYNIIYVKENKCLFTPAELIPAYLVEEQDRKELVRIFKLKNKVSLDVNFSS
ncbi:MAG: hypothetical protein V1709_10025 [Planctomycetota bacterium]